MDNLNYTKAEQSMLGLAHRVNQHRLTRDIKLAWISAIMLWIGAVSVLLVDPTSASRLAFAGTLAGWAGMFVSHIGFRSRALALMQKLQANNLLLQIPSEKNLTS